jgi:hypothetical protein
MNAVGYFDLKSHVTVDTGIAALNKHSINVSTIYAFVSVLFVIFVR